jgi:hypothetical protein
VQNWVVGITPEDFGGTGVRVSASLLSEYMSLFCRFILGVHIIMSMIEQ